MAKDTARSVLDLPVQASDDGCVVMLTDSEQWEIPIHVHNIADGTGWQGRSIPDSSIGGSELGTPSSSTEPCGTEGGAVIGCGAPPPPPHVLFCARLRAAAAAVAATDGNEAGFAEEGDDDDDEEFPTDAEIALALRTVYARHRHDLTLTWWTLMQKTETELGGADLSSRRMIETTIALIKHEEAEAARGRYANDKPTNPGVVDDACDHFAVGVATGLGVSCDGVRITGVHAGSIIVETSVTVNDGAEAVAAFASSLTDPAKALADELGPCVVSGMRVKAPTAAAAPAEAALAEPAPPPVPVMVDNSPLQAIDVVLHDDDDTRHAENEIKGPLRATIDVVLHDDDDIRHTEEEVEVRDRDGGLWDYAYAVVDEDGARDDSAFARPRRRRAVGRSQTVLVGLNDDRVHARATSYSHAVVRHAKPRRDDVHRRRQLMRMMTSIDGMMAYILSDRNEMSRHGTPGRLRGSMGFGVLCSESASIVMSAREPKK